MFEEFSFGMPSKEDVIKQRTRQETDMFNSTIAQHAANVAPQQRGVFSAFANLGRQLLGKPIAELTDQEKNKFSIIESANNKMREMQSTPDWESLDPMEKSFRVQEAIGTAAGENGDLLTSSQIAMQIASQRISATTASAKLAELAGKSKVNEAKARHYEAITDEARQNSVRTYVLPDNNGVYNFKSGPGRMAAGIIKDGVLVDGAGNTYENFLPVEDVATSMNAHSRASSAATSELSARTAASGPGRSPSEQLKATLGIRELTRLRSLAGTQSTTLALSNAVLDAFENVLKDGGAPESIVGGSGKVLSWASNMVAGVRGVIQATTGGREVKIIKGGTKQPDGSIIGGTVVSVAELAEEWADQIALPPGVEAASVEAQAFTGAIVELQYAKALGLEPGSKALSDQDVKNQALTLGSASANPVVIMKALLRNAEGETRQFGLEHRTMWARAINDGMDPARAIAALWSPEVIENSVTGVEKLRARVDALSKGRAQPTVSMPGAPANSMPGAPARQPGATSIDGFIIHE